MKFWKIIYAINLILITEHLSYSICIHLLTCQQSCRPGSLLQHRSSILHVLLFHPPQRQPPPSISQSLELRVRHGQGFFDEGSPLCRLRCRSGDGLKWLSGASGCSGLVIFQAWSVWAVLRRLRKSEGVQKESRASDFMNWLFPLNLWLKLKSLR